MHKPKGLYSRPIDTSIIKKIAPITVSGCISQKNATKRHIIHENKKTNLATKNAGFSSALTSTIIINSKQTKKNSINPPHTEITCVAANINGKINRLNENKGSFNAIDNDNELSHLIPYQQEAHVNMNKQNSSKCSPRYNESNNIPKTNTNGHRVKISEENILPRKGFEIEMNKYGLLEKIDSIQQLNNYFEAELGNTKKINEKSEEINKEIQEKNYTFPFQKRVRSQSPPKNGIVFGRKGSEDETEPSRKPVIATNNFYIGGCLKGNKKQEQCENEDSIDTGELSTGVTNGLKSSLEEENDSNWLFKQITINEGSKEPDIINRMYKEIPNFKLFNSEIFNS